MTTTNRPIRRALVSVFHKEGIEVLAEAFIKAGTEVVSTGSTAKRLAELGVKVTEVSEVTGFPECLDGRVKTLDPHIHAGILADMTNPDHASQLEKFGIKPFDLVVVNLYPFADTVRSGADEAATIEKIDIGGPSMVRGAAKNSATVAIITDPNDYALVAARIENGEGFSLDERRWLAGKAFAHTAAYDATINEWTAKHWPKPASIEQPVSEGETEVNEAKFQATFTRTWDRAHVLRYGENPHQQASLYLDPLNQNGFAHAEQLGGKPMSYNNYVDADAAWRAVWDFAPQIAVAVVKHNNPCGLAIGATVAEAHKKAHACDPMSAYGGVIAANSKVTMEMAESVRPIFTEVIVAPDYDAFKEYALNNGMHGAIVYFLSLHNEYMFKAEKTVDGYSFVTPRGWEDLSVALYEYERLNIPVTLQFVSEYAQDSKIAAEFFGYYKRYCECASVYGGEDAETGKIKKVDVEGKDFEVRYALAGLIAAKIIKLAEKYRARKSAENELDAALTAVGKNGVSLSAETDRIIKKSNSSAESRYAKTALKKLVAALGETDEKAGIAAFRKENDEKLADYKARIDNLLNFAVASLGKGQETVAMLMQVIACEHFVEILPYLGDTVFYDLNDSLLGVSGEEDYKRLAASALKG